MTFTQRPGILPLELKFHENLSEVHPLSPKSGKAHVMRLRKPSPEGAPDITYPDHGSFAAGKRFQLCFRGISLPLGGPRFPLSPKGRLGLISSCEIREGETSLYRERCRSVRGHGSNARGKTNWQRFHETIADGNSRLF